MNNDNVLSYSNWTTRWTSPVVTCVVLVSGTFLSYDFESLYDRYPRWVRQLELLHDILPIVFFSSAVLALVLALVNLLVEPSYKKLKNDLCTQKKQSEVVAYNIKNMFDGYLYQLSKKLEFGADGENCERATIYIHNNNGSFIPFGRYSANPHYSGPGRSEYPDNEGCIAVGWRNGWHFENDMGNARQYARNTTERYGIPEAIIATLKMRSCLYGIKRIDNGSGEPLAVIVVESIKSDRYDPNGLKTVLTEEEGVISELITKLKNHIPQLSFARERGF